MKIVETVKSRLEGIYDIRTFKFLLEKGKREFSFDLRPTSLNFCQLHNLKEILPLSREFKSRFFLHFQNEPDFVVHSTLEQLENDISWLNEKNLILEFSDERNADYYESLSRPFFWHFLPGDEFKNILQCSKLEGIVLSYGLLMEYHKKGELFDFLKDFYGQIGDKNIEIILKLDWDSDLFPSVINQLDYDFISLPINSKVEICYRNVDLNKVDSSLSYYQNNKLLMEL